MAQEDAKRDYNRVPGLLVHDETGVETRQVKLTSNGGIPVEVVAGGGGGGGGTQYTEGDVDATIVGTVSFMEVSGNTLQPVQGSVADGLLVNLGANNDTTVTATTDSVSSLDHGSNLDIDATAEAITATSFTAKRGVTLKASSTNTGILYIGNSDVTAGTTASTDGIPLEPGDSIFIEIDNPNKLYAIATTTNNSIYWMAL